MEALNASSTLALAVFAGIALLGGWGLRCVSRHSPVSDLPSSLGRFEPSSHRRPLDPSCPHQPIGNQPAHRMPQLEPNEKCPDRGEGHPSEHQRLHRSAPDRQRHRYHPQHGGHLEGGPEVGRQRFLPAEPVRCALRHRTTHRPPHRPQLCQSSNTR